ncbi:MAG: PD40 domain-containing protein [Bacteroidales bacterium]|nr:PD40 domain-containing protein [Bacteroidales bacterium]
MKKIPALICCLCLSCGLLAQTLSEARELLLAGDYETSRPVFAKELKKKPKDAALNYWYGLCLYHGGEKAAAVPYLQKGDKGRIKEAAYLLADCALAAYDAQGCQQYIDRYLLYGTGLHTAEIARMLRQSRKIGQMLQSVEEVVFIDSVIVHKNEVSRHLPLHPACGAIGRGDGLGLQARDCMQAFVYANEKGDRIIASDSAGIDGLDLMAYHRIPGGWEKKPVGASLNQEGNECNPYLMSDGVTLYFASDGHQSIGGYDLYVSRYNPVTEGYFSPEPLPLPFNSMANDYLYLVDEQLGRGYLVSDRRQAPDSVIIYVFLPNEVRRPVQGKNRETLVRLAEIRSIADTWNGLNADSVRLALQTAYEKAANSFAPVVSEPVLNDHEEAFLVRDDLVYHSEAEFKSPEARQLYGRYKEVENRFEALSRQLEQSRADYQQANPQQRQRLARLIEAMEGEYWGLQQDLREKENQIRALELEKL